MRAVNPFRWSRPGDMLVSNVIDGPQHIRPAGALNRADARRILHTRLTEERAVSRARQRWGSR